MVSTNLATAFWLVSLLLATINGRTVTTAACSSTSNNNAFTRYLPREIIKDQAVADGITILSHVKSDKYRQIALDELGSVGNDNYATLTLEGYKGGPVDEQINQDRAVIAITRIGSTDLWIQAVWDGHGSAGHHVSSTCQTEIPKLIRNAIEEKLVPVADKQDKDAITKIIKQILIDTFEKVDRELPDNISVEGGATATLLMWYDNHLYIANAGDSQSWLGVYIIRSNGSSTHVVHANRLDKPDDPDERQRILAAGGEVSDESESDDARVYYKNPVTGKSYGLAMSRVIGDKGATSVIATPTVHAWSIEELQQHVLETYCSVAQSNPQEAEIQADGSTSMNSDDAASKYNCTVDDLQFFAMGSSDGLIDYLDPEDMSRVMGEAFYGTAVTDKYGKTIDKPHPLAVANLIIHETANLWHNEFEGQYRDDIVLVASKLPPIMPV